MSLGDSSFSEGLNPMMGMGFVLLQCDYVTSRWHRVPAEGRNGIQESNKLYKDTSKRRGKMPQKNKKLTFIRSFPFQFFSPLVGH